jgi:hypothetical protein
MTASDIGTSPRYRVGYHIVRNLAVERNLRHTVWICALVAVMLGIGLSVIHAQHLVDPDAVHASNGQHDDARPGQAASGPHTALPILMTSGNADAMRCPAPEWATERTFTIVAPLNSNILMIFELALDRVPARWVDEVCLPVARGPDQQALLQRFRL